LPEERRPSTSSATHAGKTRELADSGRAFRFEVRIILLLTWSSSSHRGTRSVRTRANFNHNNISPCSTFTTKGAARSANKRDQKGLGTRARFHHASPAKGRSACATRSRHILSSRGRCCCCCLKRFVSCSFFLPPGHQQRARLRERKLEGCAASGLGAG